MRIRGTSQPIGGFFPVGCLAGQLLAAELNVANGSNICINATISQANSLLSSIGYEALRELTS